jgi:short-subunit dehydrogenase
MRTLKGKKGLVTGSASGIGRSITIALAREGVDLYLVDIDDINLEAVAREARSHGVEVLTAICDLSQPVQITAMVDALLSRWGRLDILINNAGLAYYGPWQIIPGALQEKILAVNLLAPIQLVRELLPSLLAQDEAHIVNIGSIFGLASMRKGLIYQTSKFGLIGFSMALNAEFGRRRFGVTTLCPGFVQTPMLYTSSVGAGHRRHVVPAWAMTDAKNVADATIRAIYKNRALVVIPLAAKLIWWLARISPNGVAWLMREGWRK